MDTDCCTCNLIAQVDAGVQAVIQTTDDISDADLTKSSHRSVGDVKATSATITCGTPLLPSCDDEGKHRYCKGTAGRSAVCRSAVMAHSCANPMHVQKQSCRQTCECCTCIKPRSEAAAAWHTAACASAADGGICWSAAVAAPTAHVPCKCACSSAAATPIEGSAAACRHEHRPKTGPGEAPSFCQQPVAVAPCRCDAANSFTNGSASVGEPAGSQAAHSADREQTALQTESRTYAMSAVAGGANAGSLPKCDDLEGSGTVVDDSFFFGDVAHPAADAERDGLLKRAVGQV